jgi:hypothetical protein
MRSDQVDTWSVWSKHVLIELERLNKGQSELQKCLNEVKMEVNMLKVKAGVWGAISGAIPIIILLAIQVMFR